ncbi:hypothetical protein [Microbispora corallina]|uniref:hypothetical protein n=1 Tax=Microbispora corallina TaxID=83302 RepID=UPI00194FD0A9
MIRIAVTGHRDVSRDSVPLLEAALRGVLASHAPDLVGISCLAAGADQLFAQTVLDLGGRLEAVVPAEAYGDGAFEALLGRAEVVRRLPYRTASPEAYAAANDVMLESADLLVAVWDGRPSRGAGGTADAVACARRRDLPVVVVWPPGTSRLDTP